MLSSLKFTSAAFQPFFESLRGNFEPAIPNDFSNTMLQPAIFNRMALRVGGESLVLSTFHTTDETRLAAAIAKIHLKMSDAVLLNEHHFVQHMSHVVRAQLGKFFVVSFLVTLITLCLFLRRIELAVIAILPILLSVPLTLGAIGLLGIPINLFSCLVAVFIFALGIEYSIFLQNACLTAYREQKTCESSVYGAVTFGSLTTIYGFGSLTLANHEGLFSIGVTISVGMIICLATSFLIVPWLMRALLSEGRCSGTSSFKSLLTATYVWGFLIARAVCYMVVVRWVARLKHGKDVVSRQRCARWYLHRSVELLLRWWPYRNNNLIVLGADPRQFSTPSIIVSNHQSAFDIIAILSLPVEMVMCVKPWVWNTPLMGNMVRDAGYVLIRGDNADEFFNMSVERLQQGVSVMVFPEGSRSSDGKMDRFHKGAFELAVRTGSDVLPVLLTSTKGCIPKGTCGVDNHCAVMRVLPRITAHSFDYAQESKILSSYVKQQMLSFEHGDWRLAFSQRDSRKSFVRFTITPEVMLSHMSGKR